MNDTIRTTAIIAAAVLLAACGGETHDPAAERDAVPAPAAAAGAELARVEFAVEGMDCGGCVIGTRMALRKLDGVVEADASYDEATGAGAAWARYDPSKVTPARMMTAIRALGYTPAVVVAEPGT